MKHCASKPRRPWAVWTILAVLLMATSGCVYLRLNSLKNQLADFKTHFEILLQPEPYIVALQPIIRTGDIPKLTGLTPSTITTNSKVVCHVYHFAKRHPKGQQKTDAFDIPIEFFFEEGLMTGIRLPERFKRYVNEDAAVPFFSQVGKADLNLREREASWAAPGTRSTMLTREEVYDQFGPPFKVHSVDRGDLYTYYYRMPNSSGDERKRDFGFWLDLTLQAGSDRVVRSELRIGGSHITIDLLPKDEL